MFASDNKRREEAEEKRHKEALEEQKRQHTESINILKEQIKFSLIGVLVGAIAGALIAGYFTFEATKQTFELQKAYLIPNEPKLHVFTTTNNIEFSKSSLSKNNSQIKNKYDLQSLEICFQNVGRISSGAINILLEGKIIVGGVDDYIPNLNGGDTSCRNIFFRYYECSFDKRCDINSLPTDRLNLNVSIDCKYCNPNKFNEIFNICIWNVTSEECRK